MFCFAHICRSQSIFLAVSNQIFQSEVFHMMSSFDVSLYHLPFRFFFCVFSILISMRNSDTSWFNIHAYVCLLCFLFLILDFFFWFCLFFFFFPFWPPVELIVGHFDSVICFFVSSFKGWSRIVFVLGFMAALFSKGVVPEGNTLWPEGA